MTGGNFSLTGGFWALYAVQTPGAPQLSILLTATNTAMVYWPSPSTGFELLQNNSVTDTTWVTPPQPVTDNGTIEVYHCESACRPALLPLAESLADDSANLLAHSGRGYTPSCAADIESVSFRDSLHRLSQPFPALFPQVRARESLRSLSEHPTSNIQHPTSNIQYPISNRPKRAEVGGSILDVGCWMLDVRGLGGDARERMSNSYYGRPASFYKPVGWSTKLQGSLNLAERRAANAFTPKVSVA